MLDHIAKVEDKLSTLQWKVLPHRVFTRLCFFRLLLISMQHGFADQHFQIYKKTKK